MISRAALASLHRLHELITGLLESVHDADSRGLFVPVPAARHRLKGLRRVMPASIN
jgi:hypothetical protein